MKLFVRILSKTQVNNFEITLINNIVSAAVNPPILAADKVQNSNSITEGYNYIKAIQDILITASFPMVKLWDSILKNDENLETILPQNQYQRRHQQKRGKPAHTQTQSRPGNKV